MIKSVFALFLCCLILLLPTGAYAHKVNLFCTFDGSALEGEGYFSGGDPVREGRISVTDARTDSALAETVTSREGTFRIDLDHTGPVKVVLEAGQGHRATWLQQTPEGNRADAGETDRRERYPTAKALAGLLTIAAVFGILYFWKRRHAA